MTEALLSGPPRPALALALGAAALLAIALAWRFRREARRIALSPFAAWRDLAGRAGMRAALGTATAAVLLAGTIAAGRLGVPGAYWLAFTAALALDAGLLAMLRATPSYASAVRMASLYTAVVGERDTAHAHLRDAFAAHPEPVVYIAPGHMLDGAVFEWVNDACVARWGRGERVLLSEPYNTFVHADDADALARYVARIDAGLGDGRGLVNHYTDPETGAKLPPQEWTQVGRTGYWIARSAEREARAVAELAAAERDLAAIRPAVEARYR